MFGGDELEHDSGRNRHMFNVQVKFEDCKLSLTVGADTGFVLSVSGPRVPEGLEFTRGNIREEV